MSWNLEERSLARRTARQLNGQLLCGLALAVAAAAAAATGLAWLATAAAVAAAPFLVVGFLFVLGAYRAGHDRTPGTTR